MIGDRIRKIMIILSLVITMVGIGDVIVTNGDEDQPPIFAMASSCSINNI